jgi:hypothetical protein
VTTAVLGRESCEGERDPALFFISTSLHLKPTRASWVDDGAVVAGPACVRPTVPTVRPAG